MRDNITLNAIVLYYIEFTKFLSVVFSNNIAKNIKYKIYSCVIYYILVLQISCKSELVLLWFRWEFVL